MGKGSGNIPRYSKPGFKAIRTPKSKGMIKQYLGGKVFGGVIRYPEGVEVNAARAAKAQALMDYNSAGYDERVRTEEMGQGKGLGAF